MTNDEALPTTPAQPATHQDAGSQPQAPAAAQTATDRPQETPGRPPVVGVMSDSPAPHSPYTSVPPMPAGYSFQRRPAQPPAETDRQDHPRQSAPAGTTGPTDAGYTPAQAAADASQPTQAEPVLASGAPTSVYDTAFAYPAYSGGQTAAQSSQPAAGYSAGMGGFPPAGGVPAASNAPRGRRKPGRRGPGWGALVGATVAAALLASGGTVAGLHYLDRGQATPVATVRTSEGGTTKTVAATGTSPDWEAVTNAVADSVVSITVATQAGTAVGSGVIYDASGHIITNNHVVAGATQIQVTLADGRIYAAELTGTDPATDLAVIALTNAPGNLTVASFGNSDDVVPGENVMAIGNPLGLSSTVTTGIVSAVNRPVVTTQKEAGSSDSQGSQGLPGGLGELLRPQQKSTSQTYTNAIQIDAAVNPGNSGGPLFDQSGQVIGITSSIAQLSQESGSIGLGFAIPGNLAVKVADQLIANGTATHAYLGVTIGDGGAQVDDAVRAGAKVGTVEAGSPADKAGIKPGDVILAIDGKTTSQAAALTGFVRQYSAGDTVTITLARDGKEQQVQAVLAERSDS